MTSGTQLSYPESVIKICGVEVGKRAFHRLDALTVHPCLVSSILGRDRQKVLERLQKERVGDNFKLRPFSSPR